jgi:hypothetical protein
VIKKFDAFFKVRKNVIFERARFNRRCQRHDESVEQFITSLYQLAEDCEYGDLKQEMFRDCIVVGIRDTSLSEKLQMDAELTLEKAKRMVRQREAIHEQQEILKELTPIDAVKRRGHVRTGRTFTGTQAPNGKCTRCGHCHTPDANAQPVRQPVMCVERKDTTQHTASPSQLLE